MSISLQEQSISEYTIHSSDRPAILIVFSTFSIHILIFFLFLILYIEVEYNFWCSGVWYMLLYSRLSSCLEFCHNHLD